MTGAYSTLVIRDLLQCFVCPSLTQGCPIIRLEGLGEVHAEHQTDMQGIYYRTDQLSASGKSVYAKEENGETVYIYYLSLGIDAWVIGRNVESTSVNAVRFESGFDYPEDIVGTPWQVVVDGSLEESTLQIVCADEPGEKPCLVCCIML